jgi:hypothetical protein
MQAGYGTNGSMADGCSICGVSYFWPGPDFDYADSPSGENADGSGDRDEYTTDGDTYDGFLARIQQTWLVLPGSSAPKRLAVSHYGPRPCLSCAAVLPSGSNGTTLDVGSTNVHDCVCSPGALTEDCARALVPWCCSLLHTQQHASTHALTAVVTAVVLLLQATGETSAPSVRQGRGGRPAFATAHLKSPFVLSSVTVRLPMLKRTADTAVLCAPRSRGGSQYEPRPACKQCPEDTTGGQAGASSPEQCGGCRAGTGGLTCDECPPGTFGVGEQQETLPQRSPSLCPSPNPSGCSWLLLCPVSLLQAARMRPAQLVDQTRCPLQAHQAGTSARAR